MSSTSSSNRQGETRFMSSPVHFVRCNFREEAMIESGKMFGIRSERWSTDSTAACLATKTDVRISAIFRASDTVGRKS